MENVPEVIRQVREELARHIAASKPGQFQPKAASLRALSGKTRELELKRQVSELTGQESRLLRQIDELWERIAKVNQSRPRSGQPVPQIYEPALAKISDEDLSRPVIIPQISAAEAEKIISYFNQQFEEKVLSQVKNSKEPQVIRERESPVLGGGAGRNLQDYLVSLKAERPSVPFADEDSQIDLSKLKNQSGKP